MLAKSIQKAVVIRTAKNSNTIAQRENNAIRAIRLRELSQRVWLHVKSQSRIDFLRSINSLT